MQTHIFLWLLRETGVLVQRFAMYLRLIEPRETAQNPILHVITVE